MFAIFVVTCFGGIRTHRLAEMCVGRRIDVVGLLFFRYHLTSPPPNPNRQTDCLLPRLLRITRMRNEMRLSLGWA